MLLRGALLSLSLLVLGCGTNTEVEPQVTITQGLYGQLTQRCDEVNCVGKPREGTPIAWFDRSPYATDGGMNPEPVQEKVSGKNGFYEFAIESNERGYLAIGELRATTGVKWFSSTAATIPRGLARIDWRAGADNDGIWTDVR
jgi:hypothetical protein